MLWLQTLPAVAVWLVFIYLRRHWVQQGLGSTEPRQGRIVLMLASVVVSLGVLFGGFYVLISQSALASNGSMTSLGIAYVAIIGLVFLHFQMLALRLTLGLAFERETRPAAPASEPADKTGESQ